MINDLTDAIIMYKQSSNEDKMNKGIDNLLRQGRQMAQNSRDWLYYFPTINLPL